MPIRSLLQRLSLATVTLLSVSFVAGCHKDGGTPPQGDTAPPLAVNDLAAGAVTQQAIELVWTAPGDEGAGKAAEYDVRYSTETITELNWTSATLLTGEPVPSAAGGSESFLVTELASDTRYSFGLKSRDEASNWSGLSNVASVLTPTRLVAVWGSSGSAEGQFLSPDGIEVDAEGRVYVVDPGNYRVQVFTSTGVFQRAFGTFGNVDPGQFIRPTSAAVDSHGDIAVTDNDYGIARHIDVFSALGEVRHYVRVAMGAGARLGGIAVGPEGFIFCVLNQSIVKYTDQYEYVTTWGGGPEGEDRTGPGQLIYPQGLVVDNAGAVYVADGDRIEVFDEDGHFLREWGREGGGDGEFRRACDVALDAHGRVYVVDMDNQRVQMFDSQGTFLSKWGWRGAGEGEFVTPRGIAIDAADFVYLVDQGHTRVQRFGPVR